MKLIAYIEGHQVDIRPAPVKREWMDSTFQRFAYHCLPLDIANAHGWEILCPSSFKAVWNGKDNLAAITVTFDDAGARPFAASHFGHGTLTFSFPCLFRTEPGWNLMVQGPVNRPKHGIAALSGVVETDWLPYTFTMNWIFTQPEVEVHFEKGEPFCHIFPVQRGVLPAVEPEFRQLSSEPELRRQYQTWNKSRLKFNSERQPPGSQGQPQRYQKMYYHGLSPDGPAGIEDHITRLRLRPFKAP